MKLILFALNHVVCITGQIEMIFFTPKAATNIHAIQINEGTVLAPIVNNLYDIKIGLL